MVKRQAFSYFLLSLLFFNSFSFSMELVGEAQEKNNQSFNNWFKESMGPILLDSAFSLQQLKNATPLFSAFPHILLNGPTGTGKTIMAEELAKGLGKKIMTLQPIEKNKKLEDSLGFKISSIFENDKLKEPYAIIIKQIDRVEDSDYGAVIGLMDAALDENKNKNQVPRVIFIATTDERQYLIKEAINSRLFPPIKVNYPDYGLHAAILSKYFTSREGINTDNCNSNLFIGYLAKKMKDFSIENIEKFLIRAEKIASEEQEGRELITLQQAHVLKAYKEIWPKTVAAEKSWPRIVNNWIRNVTKKYSPHILLATIVTEIFYKCCRLEKSIRRHNAAYFSPLYSYPASIASSIKKFILYCHQSISKKPRTDKLE